ncbi:hypothetical protein HYS28_01725 [Candidatus Uhrbacteria bacterium]|nr:hypothetical protein [Candidatus Uhrbacteria bacterium]
MKLTFPRDAVMNAVSVLRKAGYSYLVDPVTKEGSYIIRLTGDHYPRFHVYLEEHQDAVVFNLHLDQKKPSYGTGPAHNGEYDGPVVEREAKRIESWVSAALREARGKEPGHGKQPVRKWSDWFFGR